jgi:hypothetical protein
MNSSNKLTNDVQNEKESADYLFHYTNKLDHLISIMNDNFKPFYCLESLEHLNLTELKIEGMAYPLVCFCDLPLGRHEEHKEKFGNYGIGMNKDWGIKNHLSAVVYSNKESMTALGLRVLIKMGHLLQKKLTEYEFRAFNNSVSILIMNYKQYEGRSYDKKDKIFSKEPTRFYNEREWRYIPFEVEGLKLNLEIAEYQNSDILAKENKTIQANNRLMFNLNDVNFLFLNDETEIEPFLLQLKHKYSAEEIDQIRKKIQLFQK